MSPDLLLHRVHAKAFVAWRAVQVHFVHVYHRPLPLAAFVLVCLT